MAVEIREDKLSRRDYSDLGKIGVLMGGPSTEREISLKSGRAVYEALKQEGVSVELIDITSDNEDTTTRLIHSFGIDCAFIALHGRFGEDGTIQNILERMGLPYTGSGVQASRLAMDKIASLEIFSKSGLSVPGFQVAKKATALRGIKPDPAWGYPLVIKPASHGSSIGLSIIRTQGELADALELAFNYDDNVIIQKYIKGRELTVGIIDERPLPVIEIVPKNFYFDYEAKYHQGLTEYIVPAHLNGYVGALVQEAAVSAHKLLGCYGCSRVDLILTADEVPYILEINTIPGMTATSLLPKAAKVVGLDFSHLCITLLKLAYAKK